MSRGYSRYNDSIHGGYKLSYNWGGSTSLISWDFYLDIYRGWSSAGTSIILSSNLRGFAMFKLWNMGFNMGLTLSFFVMGVALYHHKSSECVFREFPEHKPSSLNGVPHVLYGSQLWIPPAFFMALSCGMDRSCILLDMCVTPWIN